MLGHKHVNGLAGQSQDTNLWVKEQREKNEEGFLYNRSPAHTCTVALTDSRERRRRTTGAALLSHGRTPHPPVSQAVIPAPKQEEPRHAYPQGCCGALAPIPGQCLYPAAQRTAGPRNRDSQITVSAVQVRATSCCNWAYRPSGHSLGSILFKFMPLFNQVKLKRVKWEPTFSNV